MDLVLVMPPLSATTALFHRQNIESLKTKYLVLEYYLSIRSKIRNYFALPDSFWVYARSIFLIKDLISEMKDLISESFSCDWDRDLLETLRYEPDSCSIVQVTGFHLKETIQYKTHKCHGGHIHYTIPKRHREH